MALKVAITKVKISHVSKSKTKRLWLPGQKRINYSIDKTMKTLRVLKYFHGQNSHSNIAIFFCFYPFILYHIVRESNHIAILFSCRIVMHKVFLVHTGPEKSSLYSGNILYLNLLQKIERVVSTRFSLQFLHQCSSYTCTSSNKVSKSPFPHEGNG